MPYINIKIARDGIDAEKKRQLIVGATALLRDVLNKDPATVVVVIEEIDTDNWGFAGESVTERRRRAALPASDEPR